MADSGEPVWIVNDLGELGVHVNGRFFFLYKGDNIEYGNGDGAAKDGIALHDDGTPIRYRVVGKREFGETCQPISRLRFSMQDVLARPVPDRHTTTLEFRPGLSFGKEGDADWQDLPA